MLIGLSMCSQIAWYFSLVMIARDIAVTFVRNWMEDCNISVVKAAKMPGKLKTTFQCSLIFVALAPNFGGKVEMVLILSALAMALSLISGMQIAILAINARDSDWLSGTDGRIGLANWWSLSRMALAMLVPYIYAAQVFGHSSNLIALVTLVVAVATDAVDGFIARLRNETTKVGKYLDPLCDKLIFYPVLISMIFVTDLAKMAPFSGNYAMRLAVYAAMFLIVFRDFGFIVWFAIWGRKMKQGMASNIWDKLRFVAIVVFLATLALLLVSVGVEAAGVLSWVMVLAIFACAALSVVTMVFGILRITNTTPVNTHKNKR